MGCRASKPEGVLGTCFGLLPRRCNHRRNKAPLCMPRLLCTTGAELHDQRGDPFFLIYATSGIHMYPRYQLTAQHTPVFCSASCWRVVHIDDASTIKAQWYPLLNERRTFFVIRSLQSFADPYVQLYYTPKSSATTRIKFGETPASKAPPCTVCILLCLRNQTALSNMLTLLVPFRWNTPVGEGHALSRMECFFLSSNIRGGRFGRLCKFFL